MIKYALNKDLKDSVALLHILSSRFFTPLSMHPFNGEWQ